MSENQIANEEARNLAICREHRLCYYPEEIGRQVDLLGKWCEHEKCQFDCPLK